jgi:integrase
MHPDSVTTWLDRFSKRHDLPHINPHAFRHTMASMLYFNGADSVSISKRLGHAQVSTTANIYAHVMEEADQKNADILSEVFLRKKTSTG